MRFGNPIRFNQPENRSKGIVAGIVAGAIISGINEASKSINILESFKKKFPACVAGWPPSHARRFDPLVLDLNGDGVKLTSLYG